MRGFVLGIIFTLLGIFLIGYLVLRSGTIDFTANPNPGKPERQIAHLALDASTAHHAPDIKNPQQPTDPNMIAGAREYEEHCTLCHGSPQAHGMNLGQVLSPRAPQLLKRPMHDPDNEIYYVIKNGVRWTGMPAWGKHMSDEEIWDMVTLLKNVDKVSPAVVQEWQKFAEPNNGEHIEHDEQRIQSANPQNSQPPQPPKGTQPLPLKH
jgi:mono/diheme cytochrome c family protein